MNQDLLECSLVFNVCVLIPPPPPPTPWVFSGVFALLQAYAFLQYLKDRLTRQEFQTLFFLGVSLAAGIVFLTVIYLTYTGMSARRASKLALPLPTSSLCICIGYCLHKQRNRIFSFFAKCRWKTHRCAGCTWKSVQTTKTNERGAGEDEPPRDHQ